MSVRIVPLGTGKCSFFGGPHDTGVKTYEGLSLVGPLDLNEQWFRQLFLPEVDELLKTGLGLARCLNPDVPYCAMRFGYGGFDGKPGEILLGSTRQEIRRAIFAIENKRTGKTAFAKAADWGPNPGTGRLIDLWPGAQEALDLNTDDQVAVTAILFASPQPPPPPNFGSKGESGAPGVHTSSPAAPGGKETPAEGSKV